MQTFIYTYNSVKFQAKYELFLEERKSTFIITLANGETLIIGPAGWLTKESRTIWVQFLGLEDKKYDYELVQAIGEGMELDI